MVFSALRSGHPPGANVGIRDELPVVSQNFPQWWERVCVQRAHGGDEIAAWFTSEMTFKISVLKVCLLPNQNSASLMFLTGCSPCRDAFYAIWCVDSTSTLQIRERIAPASSPREGHCVVMWFTCGRRKESLTRLSPDDAEAVCGCNKYCYDSTYRRCLELYNSE